MKVLLALLALVAAASAQTEPWCRCAAFITHDHSEVMVFEAPEVTIDSCVDDAKQCRTSCARELNTLSDNGNLWLMQDSGITIGQDICTYLSDRFVFFVHTKTVYGYFEVCGGAWEYSGVASQQKLCCNGGKHEHCVTE
ncbi:uncharacterized protein LOC122254762 [Penaeus japonicus]|uniref:uncharacterized protein LOC122254762 n=1 Tax=Penaeus japonicus TaxID=27405 RepID=UPI001C7159C9|nr:uncharacterized protein LOC122254762 [Penaeus japonicus]